MKILVSESKERASKHIAEEIIYTIKDKPALKIAVATGKTMIPVYKHLVRMSRAKKVKWSEVKFYMIDEYLSSNSGNEKSRFNFYLNNALFKPLGIKDRMINRLEPEKADKKYCKAYEKKITSPSLDIMLLGIGLNGHIAFNEPGSSRNSKTRKIVLSKSTIKANFKNLKNTPSTAVTIGISTILSSKRIIIAAFGKEKSEIVKKAVECRACSDVPATFLNLHSNTTMVLDKSAASKLN